MFPLLESGLGGHLLSPAYNLLCTGVHLPDESRTALEMFAGYYETKSFRANGFLKRPDFLEMANRFGMEKQLAVNKCRLTPIFWKLVRRLRLHNRYFPELGNVIETVEDLFSNWTDRADVLRRLCKV